MKVLLSLVACLFSFLISINSFAEEIDPLDFDPSLNMITLGAGSFEEVIMFDGLKGYKNGKLKNLKLQLECISKKCSNSLVLYQNRENPTGFLSVDEGENIRTFTIPLDIEIKANSESVIPDVYLRSSSEDNEGEYLIYLVGYTFENRIYTSNIYMGYIRLTSKTNINPEITVNVESNNPAYHKIIIHPDKNGNHWKVEGIEFNINSDQTFCLSTKPVCQITNNGDRINTSIDVKANNKILYIDTSEFSSRSIRDSAAALDLYLIPKKPISSIPVVTVTRVIVKNNPLGVIHWIN